MNTDKWKFDAGLLTSSQFNNRERPFWIVWSPGHGAPRTKYTACQDARSEAKRLAERNPGQKFIVLKADSAFAVAVVEATHFA